MTLTGLSLRRRASFALAMSLGTVILADWLLYNQPLGINVAIFGAALFVALLMRGGQALRTWVGLVLAVACVGIIGALVLEPGPLPVLMGMVCLFALAVADRGGWSNAAALYVLGIGRFIGRMVAQPFVDARVGHRWQRSRGMRNPVLVVLVRWVIPISLSLVFVGLFALANPIIETWLEDVPQLLAPLRIAFWMLVGLVVWGLLRAKLRKRAAADVATNAALQQPGGLGAIERDSGATWITRSLVLFNAVFAVQTVLDVVYLYGGRALPEGMTYAEYAHRGAYPLIATALLAGLFVLITFRPGGLAERSAWARRLVFLWIAQNVLLVFSSGLRLSLYVDVYSLTRWRIAAGVWMLLVAIGLITVVVRIVGRYNNRWLIQANTLAAAVVLYACCFVPFDKIIADYNVRHCREIVAVVRGEEEAALLNEELDLEYLYALGPDAIPALQRYVNALPDNAHEQKQQRAERMARVLRRDLHHQMTQWRSWTQRRALLLDDGVVAKAGERVPLPPKAPPSRPQEGPSDERGVLLRAAEGDQRL